MVKFNAAAKSAAHATGEATEKVVHAAKKWGGQGLETVTNYGKKIGHYINNSKLGQLVRNNPRFAAMGALGLVGGGYLLSTASKDSKTDGVTADKPSSPSHTMPPSGLVSPEPHMVSGRTPPMPNIAAYGDAIKQYSAADVSIGLPSKPPLDQLPPSGTIE